MKGKKCRIAFIEVESENFDSIKEICWSGFRLTRVAKLCKCSRGSFYHSSKEVDLLLFKSKGLLEMILKASVGHRSKNSKHVVENFLVHKIYLILMQEI